MPETQEATGGEATEEATMEATQEATMGATQVATIGATQEGTQERKRMIAIFKEEEMKLIEFLKENELLCNKRLMDYKDTNKYFMDYKDTNKREAV